MNNNFLILPVLSPITGRRYMRKLLVVAGAEFVPEKERGIISSNEYLSDVGG
jgi:hypothetical protein